MKENDIDAIREMVGAVPEKDAYITKEIKLKKLKDKIKVILRKENKDTTNSQIKDKLELLYDGRDALVNVTLPDIDYMENKMNTIFKNKKYESATQRKNHIRKAIYQDILGLTETEDIMNELVNKMYDINTKSNFIKGKKRLRNIAIKEINKEQLRIMDPNRIIFHNSEIQVCPLNNLTEDILYHWGPRELNADLSPDNYPMEIVGEGQKIVDKYKKKIKNVHYSYWSHAIKIKAVMQDTLISEINQALTKVKSVEANLKSELDEARENNLNLLNQCKEELKQMFEKYKNFKKVKVRLYDTGSIDRDIDSLKDIEKNILWKMEHQENCILITCRVYDDFRIKDIDRKAKCGYYKRDELASFNAIKLTVTYSLYKEYQWSKEIKLVYFIELEAKPDKSIVNIYRASDEWQYMEPEDMKGMKPFFDENITSIRQFEINN